MPKGKAYCFGPIGPIERQVNPMGLAIFELETGDSRGRRFDEATLMSAQAVVNSDAPGGAALSYEVMGHELFRVESDGGRLPMGHGELTDVPAFVVYASNGGRASLTLRLKDPILEPSDRDYGPLPLHLELDDIAIVASDHVEQEGFVDIACPDALEISNYCRTVRMGIDRLDEMSDHADYMHKHAGHLLRATSIPWHMQWERMDKEFKELQGEIDRNVRQLSRGIEDYALLKPLRALVVDSARAIHNFPKAYYGQLPTVID